MPNGPLSSQQLAEYEREGYLVVGGLIEPSVIAEADRSVWETLGLDRDDPSSWPQDVGFDTCEHPALGECFSDNLRAAAAQLTGDAIETIHVPQPCLTINRFPTKAEWELPRGHLDHSPPKLGFRSLPPAYRIGVQIFLHDVDTHAGGTCVWPRAHKLLAELAASDPDRYLYLWQLQDAMYGGPVDIGQPVEVTPDAGEVLFYAWLMPHSGTLNLGRRPRFAINHKWGALSLPYVPTPTERHAAHRL